MIATAVFAAVESAPGATGDRCGMDDDCVNRRCVDDVCRDGVTDDPCDDDSDCSNQRCVKGFCRAGNHGDMCDKDSDSTRADVMEPAKPNLATVQAATSTRIVSLGNATFVALK